MNQSFNPLENGPGLRVDDPIERRQYELRTATPVEPRHLPTDRFAFPVDDAVSIETSELVLPQVVAAYIRDGDGEMIAEAEHYAEIDLPPGEYSVELCTPIKLYLRVESALRVSADTAEMTLAFDTDAENSGTKDTGIENSAVEVLVGSRSHHEHPAATITTTDDPLDVMRAISHLGSALKTTTCERSYPTLRGHPPTIEVGDALDVPSDLEPPETGVRIEVPADYPSIFVVAPLAYYLGAEVVPGSVPRVLTDTGFEYVLDGPNGFEAEVERVLKQVFFLDCVTRTEGLYRVDLHERREVASVLDLDFGALYDEPLAAQLEAYLDVPFSLVEDHLPQWKLTTHIVPSAEHVEMVPFVVNDLAVVKTPGSGDTATTAGSGPQATAVDEFMRTGVQDFMRAGALTRSASGTARSAGPGTDVSTPGPAQRSASGLAPETPPVVQLDETDSLEQAWVGDDVPLGASKATVTAFRNKLDREATDGDIAITVVCNDEEMLAEHDDVAEVYGNREELPFDVRMYRDLSVDQLRFVLESQTDFLHYIGHIDERGFQCSDGMVDVADLDSVGVDTFFLNACRSYCQGMELIDRGAIAGVVTLEDILDSGALRIGRAMARLLNRGFPMRAALNIASGQSIIGNQYLVVGYGNMDIAHAESGTPAVFEVETDGDSESVTVDFRTYPTSHRGIGTQMIPHIKGNREYFLSSGTLKRFHLSKGRFRELAEIEVVPMRIDRELVWSNNVDLEGL